MYICPIVITQREDFTEELCVPVVARAIFIFPPPPLPSVFDRTFLCFAASIRMQQASEPYSISYFDAPRYIPLILFPRLNLYRYERTIAVSMFVCVISWNIYIFLFFGMLMKDGWNGSRKEKRREGGSWHCFNSGREWKWLYIFTIGGQGLKNKVKEKLSKFRDDRNGGRIIV